MTNEEYKDIIIKHLMSTGYVTFAKRFKDIKFIIADIYNGSPCPTAFMIPDKNTICINPGFFRVKNANDSKEINSQLDKISVIIRHELLHFLLSHEKRFIKHLKQKYPNSWGRYYSNPKMHTLANFAMDWDLCNEGYSEEDKDIIRNLHLNGRFIGGLITEDNVKNDTTSVWFDDGTREVFSGSQFNNWENTPMESMWQMLNNAHQIYTHKDPAQISNIKSPDTSAIKAKDKMPDEYKNMFNKVLQKFGNGQADVNELRELFGRLLAHEDVDIDNWTYTEQLHKETK